MGSRGQKKFALHNDKFIPYPEDFEFIFEELRECYLPFVDAKIQPAIDCVWKSDKLISGELREELLKGVSILENVPEKEKDWHPGSNKQVLDLVHPSLYPLVYGRTLHNKTDEAIPAPEPLQDEDDEYYEDDGTYSTRFQWLPSDFQIAEDGSTKIKSYINNLDPQKHNQLYPILEQIFSEFVPMFNNVLSDVREGRDYIRCVTEPSQSWEPAGMELPDGPASSNIDENNPDSSDGHSLHIHLDEENDVERYRYDGDSELVPWYMGSLSGEKFSPPELIETINGKTVKVIVKLANIILTPENPTYEGGSWHVEGMLNERIVATGVYYYDQKNITSSALCFRSIIESLDDYASASQVLNIDLSGSSVQERGYVSTRKNRAIVFPNMLQHRVTTFKLRDESEPGFRKILVFFLCDPYTNDRVVSTSIVSPQQQGHFDGQVTAMRESKHLGNLPEDIFQLILKHIPPAITPEEAKTYREELMKERMDFTTGSEKVQGVSYSLCEH